MPPGASLNAQTGLFQWTPGPSQGGDYVVTLQVSDGQATTAQNILIRASVQPALPNVTIELTPSFPALPGQQVTINVIADSVAPITGLTVLVNGQPVTLDADGRANVTAGAPGKTLITATATDEDGLVGSASTYLKVRDPNSTTPPVVSFDTAVPYAVLTTPTAILGTVADGNLDSWTLQIATPNNPNFTVLATGQSNVNDGTLATLDPSQLTNGFYQLLLTATDITGRTSQVQTQIEVNTPTKSNDYVVTETDLSVNIDGTTINVQRTYDALTRDGVGAFGYGWNFTSLQTNLQTNLPTTGREDFGVYNPFRQGTEVYVTLPTGQRVRFTFAPTSFQVAGQTFYRPAWQADPGVNFTLQSTGNVLTQSAGRFYDLATGQPYNPGNPFFSGPSYTLTGPDGTQYQLDAQGNLVGEITPNGSVFYISASSITAANGQAIQFLRDTQGRITSVVAPNGQTVAYQYDAQGNLVVMQNATTGGSQRYGYSLSDPHLLVAAVRSNGNSVVIAPGTATTAYIDGDLGGPAQFSGQTVNFDMTAGVTDRFAFRFDQAELNSTATGSVILRVVVEGTAGSYVPGIPTIAGLTPRSVEVVGNQVVALFAIDQPGLYVVALTGATPTAVGAYTLNLSVAGDLNGDGNVDGNDSALFAAALGSAVGQSNYNFAADLNGDGKVDGADQVLLDSDYGFHATTATVPTAPARPTFALDVNSATPGGNGTTTDSFVTLVGQTDPNVTVTLQPTGMTTTANPNGLFVFTNVPLLVGDNAFTAVATNADNLSSQYTGIVTRALPGLSLTPPVLSAHLADDTGRSALDNITSDATVTGSLTSTNPLVSFQAQLDQSAVTDVTATLSGTTFTIPAALLAQMNGGPLADGKHTLTLIARDTNGNQAQPVTLSFILMTTAPTPVTPQLLASSDTGISNSDGITRITTPTFSVKAPANAIVRLYSDGTLVGTATANNGPVFITTVSLSAGPHQITATAEDVAGNVSAAAAPVTIQIVTTPPATPTLGLIAADQFPSGQAEQTNLEHVTLTGTTSAGAFVALYRQVDPNTAIQKTQAGTDGSFTFANVALAAGSQPFVVVASDVAGNRSSLTQVVTTTAADTSGPVITAALANDTGVPNDGITYDPTVTGVVDDPSGVASFQAKLDNGQFVNVLSFLNGLGFTFTAANLATLNGGVALPDGQHTLSLQATDGLGHASAVFALTFTLNSTRPLPPATVHLIAADLTGTSETDTKARNLTIEMTAAPGTLVTLYQNGTQIGQQTATAAPLDFVVPGTLPDGQYLFTATAASVSGLVSPFSTPFTVTVNNAIPAIQSFGLDALSDARPFGHGITQMAIVGFVGQTLPGATVTLVETGAETTADASGNFAFFPVSVNMGANTFTLKVIDDAGNVNTLQKTITREANILATNLLPPDVIVNVSATTAQVGGTVTITVLTQTNDGQPLANEVLLVNGNMVALNGAGMATLSSAAPGVFEVTAKAFDAEGNEGDATQTIFFLTGPNGDPAPTAGFNETVVTPDITEPTAIDGTANTAAMLQYTLQYSVEGQNQWTQFASGTSPVINGLLGTIDPTLMQNGFYDVRLTVEDTSGQVTTADEVYQVSGGVKLGYFTVTFQDLNTPLPGGMNLEVSRTYDSRTKDISGDFGYGWSLSDNDVKVETSSVLGAGFIQTQTVIPPRQVSLPGLGGLGGLGGFGGLPGLGLPPGLSELPGGVQYSFQNTQNDIVTITLPDGSTQEFFMGFTGVTYNFDGPPLATTSIFFVPAPGTSTTSTLEALADNNVIVSPAQVGPVTFLDPATGLVYNPTRWKLTTENGTVFIIDDTTGLVSLTDANGNSVSFSANGETSSTGASITIARDSLGRITSITDPIGHQTTYTYDFYGNLATVTDPAGNVTRLTYDTDHTLLEVYGPDGERGTRNEYDASGRLTASVDATGYRQTYQTDLSARQEVTTDRRGFQTVLNYDANGNLLSSTNALGETTSYTYDSRGNALTVTDALGEVPKYTYDANGKMTSKTDPLGETTTYSYNSMGDLLTETDPLGHTTVNTYDVNGDLLTSTDALGDTTTNAYNSHGELTATTNALGQTTTFAYNTYGNLTSTTDALGNVTTATYDPAGNQLSQTITTANADGKPMSDTTSTEYNADNQATETVDQNGDVTLQQFDAAGNLVRKMHDNNTQADYAYNTANQLVQITYADGSTESRSYDADGNLTAEVSQTGATTRFVYDALDRVTETINPDGSTTSQSFDAIGRATVTVDVLGNQTLYSYDAGSVFQANTAASSKDAVDGRATAITNAQGNATKFGYDADGNRTSVTAPDGTTIHYQYNALNAPTETILADGTTTETTYDALGHTLTQTDQDGDTTSDSYNALGQLTAVTDALGNTTHSTYNSLGELLTQTDANGHTTTYSYDAAGNLLTTTLPLGQTAASTYNSQGLLSTSTDNNGQTTTYTYDAFRNLSVVTEPDGTLVTYHYAPGGQLQSVTDATGTTSYTYNVEGQPVEVDSPEGTIKYQYDANGNRTAVITAVSTTTYAYNSLSQLTAVTDSNGGVTAYAYDINRHITAETDPSGDVTKFTYDTAGMLTYQETDSPSHTLLSSFRYTYDPDGLKLSEVDNTGRTVVYTYDADHRLIEEVDTDTTLGNSTITYTYDAAGNRLTKTDNGQTTVYTYDANDRLLSAGATVFTYDANGNTLSQNDNGTVTTYSYNFRNQLIAVHTPTEDATFTYDEAGNLVKQVVGGQVTTYLVDTQGGLSQVLVEKDGSGNVQATNVVSGARILSMTRGGATSYFVYDGELQIRALINNQAQVTDTYVYDSFGSLIAKTGTTVNPMVFTGDLFNPLSGLYNMRARWYDPKTGRFLTADTAPGSSQNPISLNHYAYADQNPANMTDPSGHDAASDNFVNNVLPFISIALGAGLAFAPLLGPIGGILGELIGQIILSLVAAVLTADSWALFNHNKQIGGFTNAAFFATTDASLNTGGIGTVGGGGGVDAVYLGATGQDDADPTRKKGSTNPHWYTYAGFGFQFGINVSPLALLSTVVSIPIIALSCNGLRPEQ